MNNLMEAINNNDVGQFISKNDVWEKYDEISLIQLAINSIDSNKLNILDVLLNKFPLLVNRVFIINFSTVKNQVVSDYNIEYTLLTYAFSKNFNTDSIINLLMGKNPNLNIKLNGDNILHIALKNHKYNIIPLLLGKKIGMEEKDNDGKTIPELLCSIKDQKLLNYFSTPIGNASTSFELLYNKILSVKNNEKNKHFYTVRYGSLTEINDIFKDPLLLDNVNIKDDHGNCLLMYGILRDVNVLNILLKEGCEVNNPNKDNITPIMFAIYRGKTSEVEILLNNGAKDNYISRDGINFSNLISNADIDIIKLYANKYNCM
jgi:ankyrin repeat protein